MKINFFRTMIISASMVVVGTVSFAQDASLFAFETSELKEILREGADISGAVVVGVQVQRPSPDGPQLTGYVPANWRGKNLCTQVVSIDGLYEANAPYSVPDDWTGGNAVLEFPTQYVDLLRSVPNDGLGILISRGGCEQQAGNPKSVAFWNSSDVASIDIVLNSFRADEVFAYVGTNPAPIRCARLSLDSMTAFDSKCSVDVSSVSGKTTVEIYRVVGGKPSQPTVFDMWFPEVE